MLGAFLAGSPLSGQQAAPMPPLRNAAECSARGGLPNVFAKLKAGKPVNVAYLGGSITEQPGWRILSLKWLREHFPSAKIEPINAAIGGTGSDLGAFRLEKDVLQFHPDLLFVEFAVNDGGTPSEKIRKTMEGIVRQTWRKYPECDICFVYTLVGASFPGLQEGKLTQAASAMEDVADYYKIPSVHFGLKVVALAKEGKLVVSSSNARLEQVAGDALNESAPLPVDAQGRIVFSKDGVHPYPDTGHVLYTQALIRALTDIEPIGLPGKHETGTPLNPDNWERAHLVGVNDAAKISQAATGEAASAGPLEKQFANRLRGIVKLQPGDSLHFRFRGTNATLYGLRGPDSGALEVNIDGTAKKLVNFDKYCGTYRLVTLPLDENLTDAVHDVTVTVLADPIDKGGLLAGKGLESWKSNPEKFAGADCYVGALLLIGDLLPKSEIP
ncbi:MAG: SGNH/GDSL hydrolase family protein [Chthoniobacteraceae bacterium]